MESTPTDGPHGPRRLTTDDPLRAALYQYGNTVTKLRYGYFQRELSLATTQWHVAAARQQLQADLAAMGVRLRPNRLTYFCREVQRAAELWGMGEINSNQARHMWKAAARRVWGDVRPAAPRTARGDRD
jgi:hypothetical protein